MSFLTDAVSQAESQISINTKGQVNNLSSGITGAIQNAKNSAVSSVVGAANNTVKAALGSVVGAAGSLLTGNVSGALATLANAPASIITSGLGGLNGFANALGISSPGTVSSLSSSGGINPGDSLAGAQARPDPMLSFTWYAQLPVITPGSTQSSAGAASSSVLSSLAGSILSPLSSALGGSIATSNAAQLPWYYVEEAQLPFRVFETKSIFREGRDRRYPSKYNVDSLRLSIYSDVQNKAFSYLQAWNNTLVTPFTSATSATNGGGWGRPSDYKKSIFIYLLDVTNNTLAILEYSECWPVSVDSYSMDSATSTRIVNHVNFSVGDVFINLYPVSANFSASVIGSPGSNVLSTAINSVGATLQNAASSVVRAGSSAISSAVSSIF